MPHRILYVEDDDANYRLVERALAVTGRYRVERAATAAEALERIAAQPYDLVLVDLDLPDRSGLELGRSLRDDPATSKIPRIAISASVMKQEQRHAAEAGFAAFIAKPFEIAHLRRTVAAALDATPPAGPAPDGSA